MFIEVKGLRKNPDGTAVVVPTIVNTDRIITVFDYKENNYRSIVVEDNQENTVLPVSNSYEELREMLGLPPVMIGGTDATGK